MNSLITANRIVETYQPLVINFINAVSELNFDDKVPEPFLPLYGSLYDTAPIRIAFVGMETKGWGSLKEFIHDVKQNPEAALFRHKDVFDELLFCKKNWGNNFGTGFWDFIFKFLAHFHNLDDWKQLKRGERPDILKSFVWANTNALERHHVTAEKQGLSKEDWKIIKIASEPFDRSKHIINALRPHLMIICTWNTDEQWLTRDNGPFVLDDTIDSHIYNCYLSATDTHVLWTAHPRWLSQKGDFNGFIHKLADTAKQKLNI
jgi:hypothetical protein